MLRKVKKAKFWNSYYGNNARKSVLYVENKMYKDMIKLGLEYKKYFHSFYFLTKLAVVKISEPFYK